MSKKIVAAQFDWPSFVYWGDKGIAGVSPSRKPEDLKLYLQRMKDTGIEKVYWRVSFAGPVGYYSKLEYSVRERRSDKRIDPEAGDLMVPEFADVMQYDFLKAGMEFAAELGLEVHPWITPLYEGIHGSNFGGKFAGEHPEFWCKLANGETLEWHPSLAYPEVREHQVAMVEEMVTCYGVKGVHLDFIRMTRSIFDLRDKAQASMMGYDAPLVEAFKNERGKDPAKVGNTNEEWLRFRAERTYTQFLRDLRARFGRELEISVLLGDCGNLGGNLLDWHTWVKEGLVDTLCPVPTVSHNVFSYLDTAHMFKRFVGERVKVLEFIPVCDGGTGPCMNCGPDEWGTPPKPGFVLLDVEFALQRGADGVLFWEADSFEIMDYWDAAAEIARKVHQFGGR